MWTGYVGAVRRRRLKLSEKYFRQGKGGSGTIVLFSYTTGMKKTARMGVRGLFLLLFRIVPCFETLQKTGI